MFQDMVDENSFARKITRQEIDCGSIGKIQVAIQVWWLCKP